MVYNQHTRIALQVTAWGGTALTGYYGVASWYEVNPGLGGFIIAVLMFVMFAGATIGLSAVLFNGYNRGAIRLLSALLLVALFGVDMWASSNHLQTAVLTSVVNAREYDSGQANNQSTLNALKSQLAACNPSHVTKCVKPLSDKIATMQGQLNQSTGNTQALSDKVVSEKWQAIVDLMNFGRRADEQLSKTQAITYFFYIIGALIYILVIVAHGLLGSGQTVVNAIHHDEPTPQPTGTDGNARGNDYHSTRIGYNAPLPTAHHPSQPRALNTHAVSAHYTAPPAPTNAPKNLLSPTLTAQQRWGMHGNAALSEPENLPKTTSERASDGNELNDPANFAVLERVVNHPKFIDTIVDVATGTIKPSQYAMKQRHNIGGDQTYWTTLLLQAFGVISEQRPNQTRELINTLSNDNANHLAIEIKNSILGH